MGAVLAGGAARRFGGAPKGLATIDDERILDRVLGALRQATEHQVLVSSAPEASRWAPGVPVVADTLAGSGPVVGLHAALTHAAAVHAEAGVLAVAWDMPFVPGALLQALRDRAAAEGADVVLPASDRSGHGVEPLCAWYGPACRAAIEHRVAQGDRRMVGFLPGLRVAIVPASALAPFGDPARLFANVNTLDDLRALSPDAHPPSPHA